MSRADEKKDKQIEKPEMTNEQMVWDYFIDKLNRQKNKEVKNTPYNPPQGDEGVSVSKRFVPPTPEEVNAYCQERHNSIDSKEFYVSSKVAKNVVGLTFSDKCGIL